MSSAIEHLYRQLYDDEETANRWDTNTSSESYKRTSERRVMNGHSAAAPTLSVSASQAFKNSEGSYRDNLMTRQQLHGSFSYGGDTDFETLFRLVCSDVGDEMHMPTVMTVSSLQQFLQTVHLNVSSGALQELFSLIASGGRQTNSPHEVVACDDAKEVFCSDLPHWAPVLLSRCDAFANVAEAMHELDILSEELRLKEKHLGDLEHDRHSLQSEIHINKTSSTLSISRRGGASVCDPVLASALKGQEEKLGATSSQLKSSTAELAALSEKLVNGNELVRMRSLEHTEKQERYEQSERVLWDHSSDLVAIEREYIRAKERYDEAKTIQKKLFREKEAVEEGMRAAGRLLDDAEEMVTGLKKRRDMLAKDVEHRLQPEFDRLNSIVRELRIALNPPTADDVERAAERELAGKLEAEADGVTSLIERCRRELSDIKDRRDEYASLIARHKAWLYGSKRDEDEVLLRELDSCLDRAAVAQRENSRLQRMSR